MFHSKQMSPKVATLALGPELVMHKLFCPFLSCTLKKVFSSIKITRNCPRHQHTPFLFFIFFIFSFFLARAIFNEGTLGTLYVLVCMCTLLYVCGWIDFVLIWERVSIYIGSVSMCLFAYKRQSLISSCVDPVRLTWR